MSYLAQYPMLAFSGFVSFNLTSGYAYISSEINILSCKALLVDGFTLVEVMSFKLNNCIYF